ncbi:MAG: glycogen/starch synthase [Treponema sp.]|nr:glycogen/starch synthase [Treponema sp.]
MNIWMVTREYAGIAEAGGVKNVSCSLSETLAALGHRVVAFIPMYGCTDISLLKDFTEKWKESISVYSCGRKHEVSFSRGFLNGVEIILVKNPCFSEKQAVYTYTKEEEALNPHNRHGSGHRDFLLMNVIFQKSVVEYGILHSCGKSERPDIIHCQDAATAMVPTFIDFERKRRNAAARTYARTGCVVTIHNAGPGYHHDFGSIGEAENYTGLPAEELSYGLNGERVEPFLLAEKSACLTTVSPQYAEEILNDETDTAGLSGIFRERGTEIIGITNGIDISKYKPTDRKASLLPYEYDPESGDLDGKYMCREYLLEKFACEKAVDSSTFRGIETYGYIREEPGTDLAYIAYHGRVVWQKGITVLTEAADRILEKGLPARFIFIGQGQPELERELLQIALKHEGKCIYFRGYDRFLSRLCMASADMAIFPSYFEPCGLEDLIAQIFGTIPVAHATGGLCKIIDEETGFLYKQNTPEELASILESLIMIKERSGVDLFAKMISHTAENVREKFSWRQVIQTRYIPLYERLIKKPSGKKAAEKKMIRPEDDSTGR